MKNYSSKSKILYFTLSLCILIFAFSIFVWHSKTPSALPLIYKGESEGDGEVAEPEGYILHIPTGYKMLAVSDELTTIENSEGHGFQIFATAFDEQGPITAERIRQDLPDAVIKGTGQARLDGELALTYYGTDADLGDTYEVWVVHDGKLYQIMAKKADEPVIIATLNTWKWNQRVRN